MILVTLGIALKAPGAVLRKSLPKATWLESKSKHQTVATTTFHWIRTDEPTKDGSQPPLSSSSLDGAHPFLNKLLAQILSNQDIDTEPTAVDGVSTEPPLSVLVFCGSLVRAESMTKLLNQLVSQLDASGSTDGIEVSAFHRKVPLQTKLEVLQAWQQVVLRQSRLCCSDY